MDSDKQLLLGAQIRFTKMLDDPANEEHPHLVYADRGELGEIVDVGRPAPEGYWAKTKHNPPFGVSRDEFEVINNE